MKRTELRETVEEVFAEAAIDRQAGMIEGVSLLGNESANDRRYTDDAMRDAARLYEGAGFYVDHPESKSTTTRSVRDLAGKVVSAWLAGDRVKGNVQLLDNANGRLVAAIAEQMPDQAGASHRASGKVATNRNGRQLVVEITDVKSVDIVTQPATVGGLLESIEANAVEREPDLAEVKAALFSECSAPPPREILAEIEESAPETDGPDLAEIRDRLFT